MIFLTFVTKCKLICFYGWIAFRINNIYTHALTIINYKVNYKVIVNYKLKNFVVTPFAYRDEYTTKSNYKV